MIHSRPGRRAARLLTGSVAVTLLLGACSGGGTATSSGKDAAEGYDPNAKVTITWWTGQTTDAEKTAEGLAAEFMKANPNITVKTSPGAATTDDLLTKLSAAFTSDTYPDVSYAYGSWAGELAATGKTQDLTKYVADSSFNSDAGVAALETLRVMAVEDKSMYLDQTDEKYGPLFNDGHVGMMLSGPWALLDLKNAGLDYGVSLLPGYNGDHQTVSGPDL